MFFVYLFYHNMALRGILVASEQAGSAFLIV
jgi:hypothetical protein